MKIGWYTIQAAVWVALLVGWVWASLNTTKFRKLKDEVDKANDIENKLRDASAAGRFLSVSVTDQTMLSAPTGWARLRIRIRNQDPFPPVRLGILHASSLRIMKAPGAGQADNPVRFEYLNYNAGEPLPEYVDAETWIHVDRVPDRITTFHLDNVRVEFVDAHGKPAGVSVFVLKQPGLSGSMVVTQDLLEPQKNT